MENKKNTPHRILLAGTKDTCQKAIQLKFGPSDILLSMPLLTTKIMTSARVPQKRYDWLIFTSSAAVEHFFNLSLKPEFSFIAAVGPATAEQVQQYGKSVDFVPSEYNAACFAQEFTKVLDETVSVLFPCSALADNSLVGPILKKGHKVDRLDLYKPVRLPVKTLPDFDSIAFFSSSAVNAFYDRFGKNVLKGKKVAAIGARTAATIKEKFAIAALVPLSSTARETIKVLL